MSAAIRIIAIRALDGKGTLRAFVGLQLGGVTIRGAKILVQEGKPPWLAMPAVKSDRGWNNVFDLSRPLQERVTEVVLAWKTGQPEQQQERQARASAPRETPSGTVIDAAPYSRGRDDGPRDPGQQDTGDPARPFDDDCPF